MLIIACKVGIKVLFTVMLIEWPPYNVQLTCTKTDENNWDRK